MHRDLLATMHAADFELDTYTAPTEDGPVGAASSLETKENDIAFLLAGFEDGPLEHARELSGDLRSEDVQLVVRRDHPELMPLLKEMRSRAVELRDKVAPTAAKQEALTPEGAAYLRVRQQVLLCHLQYLAYYMWLKAQGGRAVVDHPVIERLVETRLLLSQLRAVDRKAESELELLRGDDATTQLLDTDTATDSASDNDDDEATSVTSSVEDETSGAGEAPTLRALVEKVAHASRKKLTSPSVATASAAFSLAADHVPHETAEDKKERRLRKEKQRALLKQTTVGDADTFADRPVDASYADPTLASAVGASNVAASLNAVRQAAAKVATARAKRGAAPDAHISARAAKRTKSHAADATDHFGGGSTGFDGQESEDSDGAAGVPRVVREAMDEKATKQHMRETKQRLKALETLPSPDETIDGKRATTCAILKNKGLTRKRKKIEGNARVHNRSKYEKKLKKLKTVLPQMRDGTASGSYEGEATGIRTHLKKSIRLAV